LKNERPALKGVWKTIAACIMSVLIGMVLSGQAPATDRFTVRWVDDGDTIVLDNSNRVRYIGINTPEIAHGKEKAEPFGGDAKTLNIQLVLHKPVRLEYDRESHDRYGRHLAYVFLKNGMFVNREIVRQGLAYYLPQKGNLRYGDELLQAQREAMASGRGIWRDWQEKEKPNAYLGNLSSKRFHRKSCRFGKRISKKNRIFFSSMLQAFRKGYAPGKRCLKTYWELK